MCSRVAMTSACNSEVENTSENVAHRSSTLTRTMLSRVVRTSAHESVVQEDCGVPNGTEDSPSAKHPDRPEVFEGLTQT